MSKDMNANALGNIHDISSMISKRSFAWGQGCVSLLELASNHLFLNEPRSVIAVSSFVSTLRETCIMPSILASDEASLIIEDMNSHLFEKTSGHRNRIGHVLQYNWSVCNKENEGIEYPSFNPLARVCLPKEGVGRNQYLKRLAGVVVSESNVLQEALFQIIKGLLIKIDQSDWSSLPDQWVGSQASFPMIVDWLMLTRHQIKGRELIANVNRNLGSKLLTSYEQASDYEIDMLLLELVSALTIFRKQNVRDRMWSASAAWSHLRGSVHSDHRLRKASTVYLCSDPDDTEDYSMLNALYIEASLAYLQDTSIGSTDGNGDVLGDMPLGYLISDLRNVRKTNMPYDVFMRGHGLRLFSVLCMGDFAELADYGDDESQSIAENAAVVLWGTTYNASSAEFAARKFLSIDPSMLMCLESNLMLMFSSDCQRPVLGHALKRENLRLLGERMFDPEAYRGPMPAAPMPLYAKN